MLTFYPQKVVAIGQKLRTPAVGVCSNPWFPTKEFPPAGGVDLPIKFINPLRHWFSFNNIWSNIGEWSLCCVVLCCVLCGIVLCVVWCCVLCVCVLCAMCVCILCVWCLCVCVRVCVCVCIDNMYLY